jgi:ABC-type spermidine/putrescine transport system permease subunit II
MATQTRITRDDLEAKFRSIERDVETTTSAIKSYAVAIGAVVAVTVVAVAFALGRRRGRAKTTVIEIKRI